MNALAGATALVVATGFAQTTKADDLIARDARGNVTTHDDRTGFGEAGQWTFSTDAALAIERRTLSDSDGAATSVSILPATDYFLIDNLSLGGVIGVVYTKSGENRSTSFRLGPRVGYNFELSRLLSLWPKLGFSYAHNKNKVDAGPVSFSDTNDAIALNLFVPVMIHPAEHFFAGFGPFLDTDLSGDNRATTWGFRLTLGGWL
jgi:hypothetical protein